MAPFFFGFFVNFYFQLLRFFTIYSYKIKNKLYKTGYFFSLGQYYKYR